MSGKHSSIHRGKMARLILNDGTVIITKFIKKDQRSNIYTEAGMFRNQEYKSLGIYKPLPHEIEKIEHIKKQCVAQSG